MVRATRKYDLSLRPNMTVSTVKRPQSLWCHSKHLVPEVCVKVNWWLAGGPAFWVITQSTEKPDLTNLKPATTHTPSVIFIWLINHIYTRWVSVVLMLGQRL